MIRTDWTVTKAALESSAPALPPRAMHVRQNPLGGHVHHLTTRDRNPAKPASIKTGGCPEDAANWLAVAQ